MKGESHQRDCHSRRYGLALEGREKLLQLALQKEELPEVEELSGDVAVPSLRCTVLRTSPTLYTCEMYTVAILGFYVHTTPGSAPYWKAPD